MPLGPFCDGSVLEKFECRGLELSDYIIVRLGDEEFKFEWDTQWPEYEVFSEYLSKCIHSMLNQGAVRRLLKK